jgi:hypothetical protein
MTKKKTPAGKEPFETQRGPGSVKDDSALAEEKVEETPFEAVASICGVLVVGLFILTFLAQNFVIPSGSMEKTLLVGDHLLVDPLLWLLRPSGCRSSITASPGAAMWWFSSSHRQNRRRMPTASRSIYSW